MKYLDLLYDNHYQHKLFYFSHGTECIYANITGKELNGGTIFRLENLFHYFFDKKIKKDVILEFECVSINDDSTVGVLEILCYDFLVKLPTLKITLKFPKVNVHDFTAKFLLLSLFYLSQNEASDPVVFLRSIELTTANYLPIFEKETNLMGFQYFREALFKPLREDRVNQLYGDVATFLQNGGAKKEWTDKLSETVIEIVDNAIKHSSGDCIAQFKILKDYKEKSTERHVTIFDASIINVSPETIDSTLSAAISADATGEERKKMVKEAYKKHAPFFGDKYREDSFYLVSAFQDGVSCRVLKDKGGGTGLTLLLKTLQNDSTYDNCYVMSGMNALYFVKGHIEMNKDGTIGFNEKNDYENLPPQEPYFQKLDFYFQGSIFNLMFVLVERENG